MPRAKKDKPVPVKAVDAPAPKAAAKKTEPEYSLGDEIEKLRAKICKDTRNPYALQRGEDFINTFAIRRPTGIASLDVSIGGGLPIAGITRIQGKASGGKNYLTNCVFREIQAVFGDQSALGTAAVELAYDKKYGHLCGVAVPLSDDEIKWEHLARAERGYPPPTPEDLARWTRRVGYFEHSPPAIAQEMLGTIETMVESNLFHAISADSFGALLTQNEEKKDLEDARTVGDVAQLVTRFVTRILPILNRRDPRGNPNRTSVIVIDQHREKIQTTGSLYDTDAGINALRHGKLLDIMVTSGNPIRKFPEAKEWGPTNPIVGKEIHWKIVKAKAGAHEGGFGTYQFYFGEHGYGFGVDIYGDLIRTAVLHRVMVLNGSWYAYNGRTLGQGEAKTGLVLQQDPALYFEIRNAIFRAANVSFLSREPF